MLETKVWEIPEKIVTKRQLRNELNLLKKAYNLIKDKTNWITGAAAVNAENNEISPRSPKAAKFCAVGSLQKYSRNVYNAQIRLDRKASELYPVSCLVSLNDGWYLGSVKNKKRTCHSRILRVFRETIKDLTQELNS